MRNKILISSSAKDTIKDSIELAKELNTGIEISRLPFYNKKETTPKDAAEILNIYLTGFNGRKTVHAMFSDVNIGSKDPYLREISELRFKQSFETAKLIGADTVLFHTGNKGTLHYDSQKSFKRKFISFFKEFIKEFETSGITAVIENVFETTPDYCLELYDGINSPNLKLALDTGHVNLYAQKTDVCDWIKAYGNRLYHMHIHNNFQQNDDHSNLLNGTLNFEKIFETIKLQGIEPSMVLEMFTEEDIKKSLELMFKLDFFKPKTV